jgi:hypothetical protein
MYSKGITWIDDCRIPFVDEGDSNKACKSDKDIGEAFNLWLFVDGKHKRTGSDTKGRFPANILVCDDMLNDGSVSKSGNTGKKDYDKHGGQWGQGKQIRGADYSDKGSNSRYYDIDKWFNNLIDG